MTNQFKVFVIEQMTNVVFAAGKEVVNSDYFVTLCKEAVR
jgi:hypothetical protein